MFCEFQSSSMQVGLFLSLTEQLHFAFNSTLNKMGTPSFTEFVKPQDFQSENLYINDNIL